MPPGSALDAARAAELDALAAKEAANPAATFWLDPPGLGRWGMTPWQRAVAMDPSRRVFVGKANDVGGTAMAAWTIRAFLGGFHPSWPRPPGRCMALFVGADLDKTFVDDVAPVLREFFPDGDLAPGCTYVKGRGFFFGGGHGIETAWGDRVLFRSGTQAALGLSGTKAQLVVINEPPRQHIWGEAMARAKGPVLVNFTSLPPKSLTGGDDLKWLFKVIDDPAAGWSEHVVPLRPHTVPHRTQDSIDEQIRNTLPWERAQRIDAAREGAAPDRRLANFDDGRVFTAQPGDWEALPGCRPGAELRLGLGADHGELTGREAWVFAAWTGRGPGATAWLLDCYESPGRTTVEQDAHAIVAMLGRWGVDPSAIDEAVGDVNSAGKSSRMRTVNEEFEAALRALGARLAVRSAVKGPGSVAHGAHVLDDALGRGALWVNAAAAPVTRAFRRWTGGDDEQKHVVDACIAGEAPVLTERGGMRMDALVAQEEWPRVAAVGPDGSVRLRRVLAAGRTRQDAPVIRLRWPGGSLRCTADHRFMLAGGMWREAASLACTDELRHLPAHGPDRVVAEEAGRADVFDLTVEEDENFIVAGLVAHNCRYLLVPVLDRTAATGVQRMVRG